jgi:co-chaperonin GroES (HSP10)
MSNKSGLHPQGVAVLCEPYEPEVKIWSDTLIIPDEVRKSLKVLENRMVVVEIGPFAWNDEAKPRAKAGAVVITTTYSGSVVTGADGRLYRMVNARDIYCTIDVAAFERAKSEAA